MHLDGTKERKDVLLFGGCIIPTQLGGEHFSLLGMSIILKVQNNVLLMTNALHVLKLKRWLNPSVSRREQERRLMRVLSLFDSDLQPLVYMIYTRRRVDHIICESGGPADAQTEHSSRITTQITRCGSESI